MNNTLSILSQFEKNKQSGKKMLAVLFDPDKVNPEKGKELAIKCEKMGVDWLMVGGSLVRDHSIKELIPFLKQQIQIPIVIFPGSPSQVVQDADALMLLSLISGRNPDLLIGRHVEAATMLKKIDLEVIPTAYMLIESGKLTTVNYISNTLPIPNDKADIALSTALAGELLGLRMVYMDGGSGAKYPVPSSMIEKVSSELDIPLIIGGGIRSKEDACLAWKAGADMIVIGTAFERDPHGSILEEICAAKLQIQA
ncbi:MAG: geranylgeranylglyceryl/heptaprenylglyceryl phosphate synthase [Bacteroidia bacterium]|nr:geranylgeranylglyceryl/heptaprenylglyceryl phosphate synthase [Bacteroidia bacterium]